MTKPKTKPTKGRSTSPPKQASETKSKKPVTVSKTVPRKETTPKKGYVKALDIEAIETPPIKQESLPAPVGIPVICGCVTYTYIKKEKSEISGNY